MSEISAIQLHGTLQSPFVRHCRIALLEQQLPFELIEVTAAESTNFSPMQKIPFMRYSQAGQVHQLTDSSSILMFIRQQANRTLFASAQEYDLYCSINTLGDAAINLFVLERTQVTPDNNSYLQRQLNRLVSGFSYLNSLDVPTQLPINDSWMRVACMVQWLQFRQRLDTTPFANLLQLVELLQQHQPFVDTTPQ